MSRLPDAPDLLDEPDLPSTDEINTQVPHGARVLNHWLGGKDTYPIDRRAGDKVAEFLPEIVPAVKHSRAFLSHAVRYLAREAGIRQFLDIGAGLPATDNTHEVAQRVTPDARVVYVDNDALVLAHARALLVGSPPGVCGHVDADVRDVATILSQAARTLDFGRPVGLLLLGVLNHLVDDTEAHATVERLVAALAPGSYVVIAHPTAELHGARVHQAMQLVMGMGGAPVRARTPRQIGSFFSGLELLEPGVVSCSLWRPEHTPFGPPPAVLQFCGVGRVPDRAAPQ